MHILIVDDQPGALKQLQDLLLQKWPEVEIYRAPDVRLALQILSEKPVDLIITDWQMPDTGGLELIRCVSNRWPDVPTIIYSGMKILPEHLKQALETGAVDYLRKPLDTLEFHARVDNALRLGRLQRNLRLRDQSKNVFFNLLSHHLINDAWQLKIALDMLQKQHMRQRFDYYQKVLVQAQEISVAHHHQIEQLLALAKLLFQPPTIRFQICQLRPYLLSCLELGEREQVRVRANAQLRAQADPQMLLRILKELTQNAIKASGNQPVRLSARQVAGRIEIQIKDAGKGLSDTALKACLTPAFSHPDAAEDFAIRGLGFAICHELLALLGSRLQGASSARGSVFSFYLDAAT